MCSPEAMGALGPGVSGAPQNGAPAPHGPLTPQPSPRRCLALASASYRRSRRGSTSRVSSRSSQRSPAGTAGASPCTGCCHTLRAGTRNHGDLPVQGPVLRASPHQHPLPAPASVPQVDGSQLTEEVESGTGGWRPCSGSPRGHGAGTGARALLQKVMLQQVSAGLTSVTRYVPSSSHRAGGFWLHCLGWQTMPLPPSRQTQSLQSNSKCSPNCREGHSEWGRELCTPRPPRQLRGASGQRGRHCARHH